MEAYLQNVSNLSQYLQEEITKSLKLSEKSSIDVINSVLSDELEVYVYGEWIHRNCQTSDSKEDKYKYKDRGLNPGHLYVFGVGVVLNNDDRNNFTDHKILDVILDSFGCIDAVEPKRQSYVLRKAMNTRGQPFLLLLLNRFLKSLLEKFGFDVVPILAESCNLNQGISKFGPQLLPPNIEYEGIIFTGSNIQTAIKMKNPCAEGNDPTNLERYEKFKKYIENSFDPLHAHIQQENKLLLKIMKQFIDYHGVGTRDKSKDDSSVQFERAYYSAKSKYPFFSDELNMKSEMSQEEESCFKELLDKYKRTLKEEITQDLRKTLSRDYEKIKENYFGNTCLEQMISDKLTHDLKFETNKT